MSLFGENGSQLTDEAGVAMLDEARSPTLEKINMSIEELSITTAPATTVRSAWTKSRTGVTTVSIRGAWGGATALSFVYSPVDGGDAVAPPNGQEFPVAKEVLADDTEKVFAIEPSSTNYVLAVIPTGNNGSTDLQIVFA